jgi:hypothetical protein
MVTQLESKKYTVVDNVLSEKALKILESYAKLLPNDKSSYDVWPSEATHSNTAPECFTCDVLGKDRLEIITELYNNEQLPCYKKTWLKDCDIAVQKLPKGGFIPKHTDHCILSLTVFLSECEGGEFFWWDTSNNKHVVTPSFNKGIIAFYDTYVRGASHEVNEVKEGIRYTMQLFVFDKKNRTQEKKSVVWDLEEQ